MPEIKLTIDCGEKLCGNCRFQLRYRRHCEAFGKDLEEHKISKRKKSCLRCQECLDAQAVCEAANRAVAYAARERRKEKGMEPLGTDKTGVQE